MGLSQGGHHAGLVGCHVGHDGRPQVGVHHHQLAGRALRGEPGQVLVGIVGHQCQAAGGDHPQGGLSGALCAHQGGIHLAVGDTFPVEAVAGLACFIETHDSQ